MKRRVRYLSSQERLEAFVDRAIAGNADVFDWWRRDAVDTELRPVRADLRPAVHEALRKKAADLEVSMAALARRIISEHLGFKDEGGK